MNPLKKKRLEAGGWKIGDSDEFLNLQNMEDKGLRFNEGKVRYDLLPPHATHELARVLTQGAKKYAPRNWEKGMEWTTVLASLKRHIAAFERGEDYDDDDGLLHISHAMCNASFLVEYYKTHPEFDDRQHSYLTAPKIGLDIDEVLADWVGAWTKLHKIERPKSWFFDRDIVKKFDKMRKNGTLEQFYLNLKPLISPDEIPFEPHCYITSRPCSVETTAKWLDKHGFPARPIHAVDNGHSKVEVAKASGIDIFVDDRFDNFVELNKAGICTFLFDSPHNQRYDVGYKRIHSLKELK